MRGKASQQTWRLAFLLGGLSLWAVAGGCRSETVSNLPETSSVQGTVILNGQPLPEGVVKFHPATSDANPASGMIQSDGTFRLSTYERHDGATIGTHKVTVVVNPRLDGSTPDPPFQIPSTYQRVETTPLEVQVTGDGTNEVKLEIKG